jgi:glycosyltransferase involved in cell wall biosynthesis
VSATVAVITNIPRPYRAALFATLKRHLAEAGLELHVLYVSDPRKHARRGSQSAMVIDPAMESFVPGINLRRGYEGVVPIPLGLPGVLAHLRPVCVVTGGFGVSAAIAARWCRRARVPHVIWWGGWPGCDDVSGGARLALRKHIVRRAAGFITYGTAAADYLVTLGAPRDRVFCAWNTVDLEGIAASARAAKTRRSELSEKYALAVMNLLFVGSLVERKGVRELVEAALASKPASSDWALHFAGGGPLTNEIETTVLAAGKEANFRFHGFMPPSDVAELLGLVDGFLLPTKQEAWGLVINEAMACGVPVVVSPLAGATRDLIEDGVTGYVVDPTDVQAMAGAVTRLLSDDHECRGVGEAGADAVRAKASLDKSAEGFVAGVLCALGRRGDG